MPGIPTKANTEAQIARMVQRIVRKFRPQQVILFGSHARGDAGPDSDVDLRVVMHFEGSALEKGLEVRQAIPGAHVSLDVIVTRPADFAWRRDVVGTIEWPAAREGKAPYAHLRSLRQGPRRRRLSALRSRPSGAGRRRGRRGDPEGPGTHRAIPSPRRVFPGPERLGRPLMMRFFSFLVLLALVGAVGVFVYQNRGAADVQFLAWAVTAPLAAVVGAAYGLGMVSGWAVVGLFRRSWRRLTEERRERR
jgi:predicted nucleotidyltransferase